VPYPSAVEMSRDKALYKSTVTFALTLLFTKYTIDPSYAETGE